MSDHEDLERTVAQTESAPVITSTELGPGQVIADRFRLEQLIGRGGMGMVWRATHLALQAPVAIKLLFPTHIDPEQAQARFLREARASAALRGNNIVQVFDYGVHQGMPYLVMELLEGATLEQRLAEVDRLSLDETLAIMTDVCAAVSRAHELDVIHRDLKPANIFLVDDGGTTRAKILDFGIAKFLGTAAEMQLAETQTGAVLGTPFYMSPEQMIASKSVDHRADLWSLGIIVHECLTGARPFESRSLTELCVMITTTEPSLDRMAGLPPGLEAWMRKALARQGEQRFSSATQMLASLQAIAAGRGFVVTEADGSGEPTRKDRHESEFEFDEDGPALSLKLPVVEQPAQPAAGPMVARASPVAAKPRGRPALAVLVGSAVAGVLGLSVYLATQHPTEQPIAPAGTDAAASSDPIDPTRAVATPDPKAHTPAATGFGDACTQASDCGWDDPCAPTRCVAGEQVGAQACAQPAEAPGECLCVAERCVLRRSEAPSKTASCEGGPCGLDQGAGLCVSGTMLEANARVEQGPACFCDPDTRRCDLQWVEPIPCRSDKQCWVSAGPPFVPVPRPRAQRNATFSPCRDGPAAPTCRDGRCSLITYGCD